MTKSELVDKMIEKVECLEKKSDAENAVTSIVDVLREALVSDDSVVFPGFGTFKIVERAERKGHNPQSHEPIVIPARKVVKFSPTKKLKEDIQ